MTQAHDIRIQPADLIDDRFDRLRRISWWNQSRLSAARVLVVGAGALGNEIVKNLALLGVGHLIVVDRDHIELSNLSRSVLFREADIGKPKAVVAADFARQIFPGIRARGVVADVLSDIGAGLFRWADVVVGGLDNREARLHINRVCWRVNRPWVDGAIEQIQGVARVFTPEPSQVQPCYECTMSKRDWDLLNQRRSCALLTRSDMLEGKTPTTPTISSIIAGVQSQEAVKLLHDMPSLAGRGWCFQGLTGESFTIDYTRKPDCLSHETLAAIEPAGRSTADITLAELLRLVQRRVGSDATIELHRDIVRSFTCATCGESKDVFRPLATVRAGEAMCPCGSETPRHATLFSRIRGDEAFLSRTCASAGIPAWDVVTGRGKDGNVGFMFDADPAICPPEFLAEEPEWL
jgi:molybdopterin/thiamine biosynthesis adenylyltransferase